MFGLSFTHLILLAVIALVVLGPEQLPEVARTLAKLLNEWRRASSDIQSSLVQTFKHDINPNTPPYVPPPVVDPAHVAQEFHAPHDEPPLHSDSVELSDTTAVVEGDDAVVLPIGQVDDSEKKS
jgi:sec-independent protein translocase protein TatB